MDTSLKHRLIGAIVLVALAVLFLPMLVTGPPRESAVQDVAIEVPGQPANAQFETRELPLAAPVGGSTGLQTTAAPVREAPAGGAPADGAGPGAAAGNYAVTFGAYASQAHADAVIAHLKGAQLPGFSEQTVINGTPAWRVRVGPFADRAQAESARLQAVQVRNDVKAEVITLDAAAAPVAAAPPSASTTAPPTTPAAPAPVVQTQPLPATPAPDPAPAPKPEPKPEPKPVAKPVEPKPEPKTEPKAEPKTEPRTPAAPAASGVGFAVQLGAFGKAEDANALRDKVRSAGFSAFVEQVRTDKGVLHRVRVGPVASRAEADQLKAQVASRVGVAGMVRPHP